MNYDALKFLLELLVLAATAANSLVLFLRKPGQDAIKGVASLREDVDTQLKAVHKDLAVLQERIAHMPTDEELAKLSGAVHALTEHSATMARQLDRIENYLLNHKK